MFQAISCSAPGLREFRPAVIKYLNDQFIYLEGGIRNLLRDTGHVCLDDLRAKLRTYPISPCVIDAIAEHFAATASPEIPGAPNTDILTRTQVAQVLVSLSEAFKLLEDHDVLGSFASREDGLLDADELDTLLSRAERELELDPRSLTAHILLHLASHLRASAV